MSNLQPQEAWTYQDKETLKLTQLVYDSINRVGIKTVLERVMFKLSPYKNEYKNSKSRVEECLNHINIEGSIEGTYDNDVARALVWCLKKGPNEKKNNKNFRDPIIVSTKEKKLSNDILEHNTISYNESRQYDPKKNGMNYLKHGLFFDDVMSYCVGEFGRLLTHSNHRGEDRQVVFSRYRKNDIDQHTVSIVIYSPIDKLSETSAEVHEKAA